MVRNKNGEVQSVQYHVLPVLLLNEMQKQYEDLTKCNNELLYHRALIAQLEAAIQAFAERIDVLETHNISAIN